MHLVVLDEAKLQLESILAQGIDEHVAQMTDDDGYILHPARLQPVQDSYNQGYAVDELKRLRVRLAIDKSFPPSGGQDNRAVHSNSLLHFVWCSHAKRSL